MPRVHRRNILVLILVCLGLTGCAPLVKAEQPAQSGFILLESGKTAGQTFVARYAGMEGVAVYLKPEAPGVGDLRLHLRSGPEATFDVATAQLPVMEVTAPGFYRLDFPALDGSTNQDYYFFLEVLGAGRLWVGTAPGDTYLNGALYQNHQPKDEQLAFRLAYRPLSLFSGLAREGLRWTGWTLAGVFLFILPGWALLRLLLPAWRRLSWGEKLGLAGGSSTALYPLLFLWADLAGLRPGALFAWIPPLLALAAIAWPVRRATMKKEPALSVAKGQKPKEQAQQKTGWLPELALVFVAGLVLATRFWAIRGLDAPLWGDSYQHTMIAQLLVDHGGLFTSWEPYAAYRSLTVHYGFSASAALLAWLTGSAVPAATLLAGQLLNVLAVLSLYPLAARISGGDRWAGVGTVLLAGLLSPMPAYYVNWGRYAQLAGQAVLPVALWLLWELLPGRHQAETAGEGALAAVRTGVSSRRVLLLSGLVLAGLLLNYYRIAFYYAAFVIVWLAGWGLPRLRLGPRQWAAILGRLALVAVIGSLLFLPWGLRLLGGKLAGAVEAGVTAGSPTQSILGDFQAWQQIRFYAPPVILILALAGTGFSLIQRRWMILALIFWPLLLAGYVASALIRLPGANMLQSFAILIALYMPLSLLGGWLVGQLARVARDGDLPAGFILAGAALAAAALWGAWNQRAIVQPADFALVTRPDLRAMRWIRENTPPEARFLVEGFRIFGGDSAVGADAGWWIPLLAGRLNTMPPQYALLSEAPAPENLSRDLVELVAALEAGSPASPAGLARLCEQEITHVYVGQRQGRVGAGVKQLFTQEALQESASFDLVYHQDRVFIFALQPEQCAAGP
jgi:hypothetical protein